MAANGISTLALKRDRQNAKLAAAATARLASGRRNTLDNTQLPTLYNATSNAGALVDNPNVGGLVAGRPWT
jgi:hypothetical protein